MKDDRSFLILCLSVALAGCAIEPRRNYTPQPKDATLHFRSTGMPMSAGFSISSASTACEGFEFAGSVRDGGEGVLLPWIAALSNKLSGVPTVREAAVPADAPVQVKGFSSWQDQYSRGSCGPVTKRFTPTADGVYRVDFVWAGMRKCGLRIVDISRPDEPREVPGAPLICPRPPGL
ncbi:MULTISPECIES: hypothetical protein [unclassified Delftia]|uniref:hypothetical protein n=1 Tax=unclassified Delftia TaxID=2613839 RepID=UPI0019010C72|nr:MULTISPECIES: hypothetical protein [unclassified Delftia]MBK0112320.1 hypothetical protein [Delftia sp. S65]MBK0118839.1 hypothetical protein [Delftia sp. S67]MBK0130097.1 hypothetical protein [Delftia sp. S66]